MEWHQLPRTGRTQNRTQMQTAENVGAVLMLGILSITAAESYKEADR